MSRLSRARVGVGLLSLAGTAVGHFLTYLIAAPDSHDREDLLEATGHTGESPFLIVAIAALLASCIAVLARERHPSTSIVRTFGRLMFLQGAAFMGLEVIERVLSGKTPIDALSEPVLWLGLLVQVVVALAAAFVLRTLRAVASGATPRPPLPTGLEIVLPIGAAVAAATSGEHRPRPARGPPASS